MSSPGRSTRTLRTTRRPRCGALLNGPRRPWPADSHGVVAHHIVRCAAIAARRDIPREAHCGLPASSSARSSGAPARRPPCGPAAAEPRRPSPPPPPRRITPGDSSRSTRCPAVPRDGQAVDVDDQRLRTPRRAPLQPLAQHLDAVHHAATRRDSVGCEGRRPPLPREVPARSLVASCSAGCPAAVASLCSRRPCPASSGVRASRLCAGSGARPACPATASQKPHHPAAPQPRPVSAPESPVISPAGAGLGA